MRKILGLVLVLGLVLTTAGFAGADNYVKKTTAYIEVAEVVLVANEHVRITVFSPPIEVRDKMGWLAYGFYTEIEIYNKDGDYPLSDFSITQGDEKYFMSFKVVEDGIRGIHLGEIMIRYFGKRGMIILSYTEDRRNSDPLDRREEINFCEDFTLQYGKSSVIMKKVQPLGWHLGLNSIQK